jgi:hypothetical protein
MRNVIVPTLVAVAFASASLAVDEEKLDDCRAAIFLELLALGSRAPGEEAGAFLVNDPNGGLRCELWPGPQKRRRAEYEGPIPDGTIALAHTHPNLQHLRAPSAKDGEEAERLALPIYVISRFQLWVVNAKGDRRRLPRPTPARHKGDCSCGSAHH